MRKKKLDEVMMCLSAFFDYTRRCDMQATQFQVCGDGHHRFSIIACFIVEGLLLVVIHDKLKLDCHWQS